MFVPSQHALIEGEGIVIDVHFSLDCDGQCGLGNNILYTQIDKILYPARIPVKRKLKSCETNKKLLVSF